MIEQVVLVDDEGRAVGRTDKASVHTGHTPLHLGFSCYLIGSDGRLLLTVRAEGKTFEGVLTNSFCGHPAPGEQLADAVRRRARDELGAELGEIRLVLPDFRYRAEQGGIVENELCPVVLAVADGDAVHPDPSEVARTEWVSWPQLRADVLAGRREVSPWFVEQIAVLAEHGDDPLDWPAGDAARLPQALREAAGPE